MPGERNAAARAVVLAGVLVVGAVGCGSDAGQKPDPEAVALVRAANAQMERESFRSTGSTTAFPGAKQETWSDPAQGLHMEVTGGALGTVYCKDGTSYTSAGLFAEALRRRGKEITVPPRLQGMYVTTKADGGCAVYYRIAETAHRVPGRDGSVDGKRVSAVEVAEGGSKDVYSIEDATKRLLKLESRREGGEVSTTAYDSFGQSVTITLPVAEKVMPLDAFRYQVSG
ncbi:hypothetical protein [Streptomyces sp. NRRL S-244]|uniref:hypothetical protein n=1 Tax=Streptomyces sp. NRRL S-244 TaxID=1463897 RepID=UPI00131A51DE|nr:hypothetical protein [Streptomyces sp. NRRL S-244]